MLVFQIILNLKRKTPNIELFGLFRKKSGNTANINKPNFGSKKIVWSFLLEKGEASKALEYSQMSASEAVTSTTAQSGTKSSNLDSTPNSSSTREVGNQATWSLSSCKPGEK